MRQGRRRRGRRSLVLVRLLFQHAQFPWGAVVVFCHSSCVTVQPPAVSVWVSAQVSGSILCFSEEDVFAQLQLDYVPPHERNAYENFQLPSDGDEKAIE